MKYIIDIDGTLLNSEEAAAGAKELIDFFNKHSVDYLVMTNSIRKPMLQVQRLRNAGIEVDISRILHPITAINQYLKEKNLTRAKILGTTEEFEQVEAHSCTRDYEITILLDFEKGNKTYDDLQGIIRDLEDGKEVVTASISEYYLKNGKKQIDTGAFVHLCEQITGIPINNFGKPSIDFFQIAAKMLQAEMDDLYVIGDDWSTDILGANQCHAKSILVKSGKFKEGDEEKEAPYKVISTLTEVIELHRLKSYRGPTFH